ncbi:MAG TPA: 16S rRNA processing protein RimM [Flavihumibacter sp.]|nr:16S rRNA processing protein RimM [Bacteroidota bacterium]HOA37005.1 16S rRNA processing protein RimM [Flavihumibacter sp.]HQD08057.1 16S rRNA processing protein RimM [Flavihumibacter sp.]
MNYLSIGKIVGSFGTQGEVVLQHALGKKTALKDLEAIFVEMRKGELLPYFLVSARAKSDTEIYLKLDGVDNREAALKLNQRPVWLEEADFKKHAAASAPVSLLGFSVVHAGENLGEILEVIEQPHQVLCRIDFKGNEALLPVNDSTLVKVDQPARLVYLNLPDGLLDLYA